MLRLLPRPKANQPRRNKRSNVRSAHSLKGAMIGRSSDGLFVSIVECAVRSVEHAGLIGEEADLLALFRGLAGKLQPLLPG